MTTDAEMLGLAEDPKLAAAEEAAFVKGFNDNYVPLDEKTHADETPEEVPAGPPVEPAPGETPAPVEPAPGETPAPVEPAEPPKLFAGLTEEQLQAALARSGTLQGTVDKMAGRIGQLMQQIEALRKSPPTTQAAQTALNLKLEKLSGSFPELAELLREDLQSLQAPAPTLVETPPTGITQEQFDAALAERLAQSQATIDEKIEMKVLSIAHPDWLTVIKTPQFALWRDNVLGAEAGKALMESEDSGFISEKLTAFKKWREAPPPPAAVVPEAPKRSARLGNAVLPATTTPVAVGGPVTEEDAFVSGFKNEQRRAGRA